MSGGELKSVHKPPRTSDWSTFLGEIRRREFLQDSAFFVFLTFAARFGGEKTAASPLGVFLLTQPYESPITRRTIPLTPDEIVSGHVGILGSSYPHGEGGTPPGVLMVQRIDQGNIGQWTAKDASASGSFVSDIPDQAKELRRSYPSTGTRLLIADSGYNSVTEGVLTDSTVADDFSYILDILDGNAVSMGDYPKILRLLNHICEAFLISVKNTGHDLLQTLPPILQEMSIDAGFLYKFPPLQDARALVHIPRKGNPDDRQVVVPIRGNGIRQLFARHVTTHGSNMAERVVEKLTLDFPNCCLVPLDLAKTLKLQYYTRQDEHPNEQGWVMVSTAQLESVIVNGESLSAKIGSRR